jgi:hypothetical protein
MVASDGSGRRSWRPLAVIQLELFLSQVLMQTPQDSSGKGGALAICHPRVRRGSSVFSVLANARKFTRIARTVIPMSDGGSGSDRQLNLQLTYNYA